ncbi:hypothetical protein EYF80_015528 [Liparis tanakae]|uniref:Uncharacterized protein n=1 Tax=Liparis tanakae TaxID=230148 RepID=A0A4Z2IA59_9TELE|nr:hypothetical protein EYF80_015528 [Liparis tanakae]
MSLLKSSSAKVIGKSYCFCFAIKHQIESPHPPVAINVKGNKRDQHLTGFWQPALAGIILDYCSRLET